ncbi:hypothetical protein MesoLjLb_75850 [Mesorhizobium sp. L-8-3]|nr:hypothetical protein MesoLjLb_75850 [Mesorhizobium sp. L-8-3]
MSIGDHVVLEAEPWFEVDALTISRTARHEGRAERPEIRDVLRAVELYQGPFLESEDAEFFVEERERLHSCFVELAHCALKHHMRARAWTEAIAICRKVLTHDPYREMFVRTLVALLCLDECRVEAIRYGERWRKTLLTEIGVEPMPETRRVFQQIRECAYDGDLVDLERTIATGLSVAEE